MSSAIEQARTESAVEYYAGDDWWLDPYIVWSFLAAVTRRAQLSSDIMIVPYRNPIVQAKMLGTLDVLSDGRMIFGTGTGHVESESAALGIDYEARGRMHDEYLRIIIQLLSNEETSFEGEFFRFGPVRSLIRPVQQPHPPIYVGGNSKRAIRRAVEFGQGWLPGGSDPRALRRGIEYLDRLCEQTGRQSRPDVALSTRLKIEDGDAPPSRRGNLSVDETIRLFQDYESIGVDHVSVVFPVPNLHVYLRQIELFASKVMPALRS
jgi:probable F420-dependent oxidoreductase